MSIKKTLLNMLNDLKSGKVLPSILFAELQDYSFGNSKFSVTLAFALNEARREGKLNMSKFHNAKVVLDIALLAC